MKNFKIILSMRANLSLLFIFSIFINYSIKAQPSQSILFGKDIIINEQPTENQQAVAICSAPNGWLFASYSHNNPTNFSSLAILRSKDSGITWEKIFDGDVGLYNVVIPKIDIVAGGENPENYKVFIAMELYDTIQDLYYPGVSRINANTGLLETCMFSDNFYPFSDIALATDMGVPSSGTNPFSIAVLYSRCGVHYDTLFIRTSSNGGQFFDSIQVIDAASYPETSSIRRVDLSYGYSPSQNTGRYYAVWEKQDRSNPDIHRIYTAHSEPNFNSGFTAPIRLDTIDPTGADLCIRPVISCQYGGTDNNSANFSEIVLFQRLIPNENRYQIAGCYNTHAATTSSFLPMGFESTNHNTIQPDIAFNTYTNEFVATFFDSDSKCLSLVTQDMNIQNPNAWPVISNKYNDDTVLSLPNPRVGISNSQEKAMNVWISDLFPGAGNALFDAQYSSYTNSNDSRYEVKDNDIRIFPNPCSNNTTIMYRTKTETSISVFITDMLGKRTLLKTECGVEPGIHKTIIDVSGFSQGLYNISLTSTDYVTSSMVTIIKN